MLESSPLPDTSGNPLGSILKKIWVGRFLMVGVALYCMIIFVFAITLIPPQFSATASVDLYPDAYHIDAPEKIMKEQNLTQDDLLREEQIVRHADFLINVIKHWKLQERAEFCPELEKTPSLATQLYRKIFSPPDLCDAAQDHILKQMQDELQISVTPIRMTVTYTSASPYLARALANTITKDYESIPSDGMRKKIAYLSGLPMYSTSPHRIPLLCFSLLVALLVGAVFACAIPMNTSGIKT